MCGARHTPSELTRWRLRYGIREGVQSVFWVERLFDCAVLCRAAVAYVLLEVTIVPDELGLKISAKTTALDQTLKILLQRKIRIECCIVGHPISPYSHRNKILTPVIQKRRAEAPMGQI